MAYLMIAVAPVPEARRAEYERHCAAVTPLFLEHGAVRVTECWGDSVPPGEATSFPLAVKLEEGEVVAVSIAEWPTKEAYDAGIDGAMAAMNDAMAENPMPFDASRLIFGAFTTLLDRHSDQHSDGKG